MPSWRERAAAVQAVLTSSPFRPMPLSRRLTKKFSPSLVLNAVSCSKASRKWKAERESVPAARVSLSSNGTYPRQTRVKGCHPLIVLQTDSRSEASSHPADSENFEAVDFDCFIQSKRKQVDSKLSQANHSQYSGIEILQRPIRWVDFDFANMVPSVTTPTNLVLIR